MGGYFLSNHVFLLLKHKYLIEQKLPNLCKNIERSTYHSIVSLSSQKPVLFMKQSWLGK